MSKPQYEPSARFRSNMAMIDAILEDVKKEMIESNHQVGILFSVIFLHRDSLDEVSHVYVHGNVKKSIEAIADLLIEAQEKGTQ